MRPSWQSRVLNFVLRMYLKRVISRLAQEKSPIKLAEVIKNIRLKTEQYAFPLPIDAKVSDVSIGHINAKWVSISNKETKRTILYLHGGSYVFGSSLTYLDMAYRLALSCDARVLIIDYRLAPEHPVSCALEDAMMAYRYLRETDRHHSEIIFAGDSAGGGLTLSTLVNLRDANEPMPRAAVCISPWTDLALKGPSIKHNRDNDPYIVVPEKICFLGDINVYDPLISPLYADLYDLPPLFIQVGSIEVLLDDSRRFAEKARHANVDVTLEIWDGMPHCWHFFAKYLPEGQEAINNINVFLNTL